MRLSYACYVILALIDCVTMLVHLVCFFLCYQLHALTHVYPYCIVTRALHVSRHFVMGSRKVHVIFLNACMGHHGDDCEWTMMPNALWIKRDDLSSSRVRKCIHVMHRISISPWHRNERIVPAFVIYHFMHCILHKSFHQHASASTMLFAYLLFSCLLMHDPCIFLCKTKTKKSMKIHTEHGTYCMVN